MNSAVTIVALVAGSYTATNIDNLLLLVSWMLGRQVSRHEILSGHILAVLAVVGLSILLGLSSSAIPVQYIGYAGIVPMLLGAKMLADRFRNHGRQPTLAGAAGVTTFAMATTLIGNSTDSILVLIPLLSDSRSGYDWIIISAYILMALAWFLLAHLFAHHAAKLKRLTAVATWVAPLIMIGVGLYILNNTMTDVMPGN